MESFIATLISVLTSERVITSYVLVIAVVIEVWLLLIRGRITSTPDTGRANRAPESGPRIKVTVVNNVPGEKSVRRKRRMKQRQVRRRRRLSLRCCNDETCQEQ